MADELKVADNPATSPPVSERIDVGEMADYASAIFQHHLVAADEAMERSIPFEFKVCDDNLAVGFSTRGKR